MSENYTTLQNITYTHTHTLYTKIPVYSKTRTFHERVGSARRRLRRTKKEGRKTVLRRTPPSSKNPPFFEEPPLVFSFFGSEDRRTPHLRSSEPKIGSNIAVGLVVTGRRRDSSPRRIQLLLFCRRRKNVLLCLSLEARTKETLCKPMEEQNPRLTRK